MAGQNGVLGEREVLVEVELGRLAEYLQEPDHGSDAKDQVERREDLVQVAMLLLDVVAWYVVPETHCRQRDEAVVEGVEVRPAFDVGVDVRWDYEEEDQYE